jgi:hypothetical protein
MKIDPLVCDCDLTQNYRASNALSEGANTCGRHVATLRAQEYKEHPNVSEDSI